MPNESVSHTPGPLGIQPMPGQSYRILGGPRNSRLADVYATAAHNGEANARLFAAAPDLYEAAQVAESYFAGAVERAVSSGCDAPAHLVEPLRQLRAAIAKATEGVA